MHVLILGASGLLGSSLFRYFSKLEGIAVSGTVRRQADIALFPSSLGGQLRADVDVLSSDLQQVLEDINPDIIVNCIGVVKQLSSAGEPLQAIPLNALLPHRLAAFATDLDARLIHFSTDCVFTGAAGMYRETDLPDASDLYGRSKLLGEVAYPNAITLRTSLIGHEMMGARSLISWFLAQEGPINGFAGAVFSGLPTVEIASVIAQHVIPRPELCGLYHLSAEPINKYELLSLVAEIYGKDIEIQPCEVPKIDRSLDSSLFCAATSYTPPPWRRLITHMHEFG